MNKYIIFLLVTVSKIVTIAVLSLNLTKLTNGTNFLFVLLCVICVLILFYIFRTVAIFLFYSKFNTQLSFNIL